MATGLRNSAAPRFMHALCEFECIVQLMRNECGNRLRPWGLGAPVIKPEP
jgi:hypothetical protein